MSSSDKFNSHECCYLRHSCSRVLFHALIRHEENVLVISMRQKAQNVVKIVSILESSIHKHLKEVVKTGVPFITMFLMVELSNDYILWIA